MATPGRAMRLIPRTTLSMVLGVALAATFAAPGYAQPSDVPDAGDRPVPAGDLPLPDGSFAQPPDPSQAVTGPLAAEVAELEIEVQKLTAELQTIEPELGPAEAQLSQTDQQWRTASQELEDAKRVLDDLVSDSYRGAAALPPDLFIPELRGLSAHAPVPVEAPLGAGAAARRLLDARAAEQEASNLFETALGTEQELSKRRATIEAELARLEPRLQRLRDRNAALLAEQERAREAAAQEQDFPITEPVAGFRASGAAVRAVEFALGELGKPYEWGAEGPDRYDCSGLMWAAYRSVGQSLPRVAADQYWGTRTRLVATGATMGRQGLLPGDLVFFASGPSWQSIHHVGMYVGNGYMVHAPNRNEVVKVSPVSQFFAATRVVPAVPAPGGDPGPNPGAGSGSGSGPGSGSDSGSGSGQDPAPTPGPSPTGGGVRPPDPDPTDPGPGTTTSPPTTPPPVTSPPPDPEPETTTVPSLIGLSQSEVVAAIEAAQLEPDPSPERVVDSTCAPDTVIAQDPPADAVVEVGTTVTYSLCEAPGEGPAETPTPTDTGGAASPSPTPS
ncbi:MAG: PASTA domain-containing protein [Micromonosporaceae bacterium]|nr:PASTA domain-containing protein [Micromonosporaceae bacterium]